MKSVTSQAVANYFNLSDGQGEQVLAKLSQPLLICTGLLVAFIVTTILVAARYTHRIFGPLVSIHRFLDDIIQKRPATNLVLRESDQLQDLAVKLNVIAQLLQQNGGSPSSKEVDRTA